MGLLSSALPALVESKFASAKSSGGLIFSLTELAVIRTSLGIPFQLRYCPALAKKPQANPEAKSKKIDPFDNPAPDLLVAEVPEKNATHTVVLNKFPIIEDHIILATKPYKKQTDLLEQDDIGLTYACLKAWEEAGDGRKRRLFAFFNSGEHSGASQPHRHIQFVPVEKMAGGLQAQGWDVLTDVVASSADSTTSGPHGFLSHPSLPFTHYVSRLPPDPNPARLHETYQELYKAAESAVHDFVQANPSSQDLISTSTGTGQISYNLSMTTSAMGICPRRREGLVIQREKSNESGFVALNGTMLAGTLMVKSPEEWASLQASSATFDSILEAIGIPKKVPGHL